MYKSQIHKSLHPDSHSMIKHSENQQKLGSREACHMMHKTSLCGLGVQAVVCLAEG